MTRAVRRSLDPPPRVGVFAHTQNTARTLAQELRLPTPVCMSPTTVKNGAGRGVNLGALLIAEDCWPLTEDQKDALAPSLALHGGYALKVSRHDLLRDEEEE